MQTYIHLITLSTEGLAALSDGHEPSPVATAAEFGGEILADYLTLGQYDIVVVSAFPNDESATWFALAMGGGGHSRSETMRAFDTDEFGAILEGMRQAGE